MRFILSLLVGSILVGAVPRPADAQEAPQPQPKPVQVTVRKMTYPVRQAAPKAKYAYLKTNPRLVGKTDYTTEAVVLENDYVRVIVLPEFGARLPHVVFKKPDRDLFWVNDALEDNMPWSMGGIRFTFPFYEHGRHMDEGAGWRILKRWDGGATVAMDMRFSQYKGEVQRYGRFSALRQATYVTLLPDSNWVEYTARVDNPLPVRHGFRLWSVAHFARRAGAHVLFPVGAVTDHGAPSMQPWPTWDETDHSVLGSWGTSRFSVDTQGDWCGVYYPDDDANHLILKPRFTAPGTKLYASGLNPEHQGRWDPMIEIWCGSNHVFEHPGHYLPPFGTYSMPLKLTMVRGIGRVDWANDNVAVAYERVGAGAEIRIAGHQAAVNVTAYASLAGRTVKEQGRLAPDQPLVVSIQQRAEPVRLRVVNADGDALAEVHLPWKPEPTDPQVFEAIQNEVRDKSWLAMELSDWPREHAPNLENAAQALASEPNLARTEHAVHAARILIRTDEPGSPRWKQVRSALEAYLAAHPDSAHGQLYLAMMLTLESGGRIGPRAADLARGAQGLPGAAYVLALEAVAAGNLTGAVKHLTAAAGQAPPAAMGLGKRSIMGNDRLHPAAMTGGQWPTLVQAAVLLCLQRTGPAAGAVEAILTQDPARPEAAALAAKAYADSNEADKSRAARALAENLFRMNDQARKDYERLVRSAREGTLEPVPRP